MVQLLDLKRIIDELTSLCEAYRSKDWCDINGNGEEQVREFREPYLRLHREVVDYFVLIGQGQFSRDMLDRHDSTQERIVLEDRLCGKRAEIQNMWDFYHEVAALPNAIRQLPAFNLHRAEDYGKALVLSRTGSSGEVSEASMGVILNGGNDNDAQYLHGKWFLAQLFLEQQPARIEAVTTAADEFERRFKKASVQERQALTVFKRNQYPTYNTQNYQVAYQQWCLARFREIVGR